MKYLFNHAIVDTQIWMSEIPFLDGIAIFLPSWVLQIVGITIISVLSPSPHEIEIVIIQLLISYWLYLTDA